MSNKLVKQAGNYTHGFKINTQAFLAEWFENGTTEAQQSALQIPFQFLIRYLASLTNRCGEINDPVLNKLMCEMSLYSMADPYSEDYRPEYIETVEREYEEFRSGSDE